MGGVDIHADTVNAMNENEEVLRAAQEEANRLTDEIHSLEERLERLNEFIDGGEDQLKMLRDLSDGEIDSTFESLAGKVMEKTFELDETVEVVRQKRNERRECGELLKAMRSDCELTDEQKALSRRLQATQDVTARIEFDGASRGNPGAAAIGYVVETDDWCEEGNEFLGKATNNTAEYTALLRAVETAAEEGCTTVTAVGDSQLVVKQMQGEYSTNEDHLIELREQVRDVVAEFEEFDIQWVERDENSRADELANLALDEALVTE